MVALVLAPCIASAADEACFESYESAQRLRRKNELARAKEAMRGCLAPSCPALLRTDCAAWLAEAEADTPSLRIETDAREPVRSAKVDGGDVTMGAVVTVDPGRHHVVVVTESTSRELHVDVARGEKDKRVLVSFAPAPLERAPSEPRNVPSSVWITGGLSILGFGTFGIVGGIARSEHASLEESCSPRCAPRDSERLSTMYVVADVALGAALILAVTATALYLTR